MTKLSDLKKQLMDKEKEKESVMDKLKDLYDEINQLNHDIMEVDPQYIKIECSVCNGSGRLRGEKVIERMKQGENWNLSEMPKPDKLYVCIHCGMHGYLWAKKYKE